MRGIPSKRTKNNSNSTEKGIHGMRSRPTSRTKRCRNDKHVTRFPRVVLFLQWMSYVLLTMLSVGPVFYFEFVSFKATSLRMDMFTSLNIISFDADRYLNVLKSGALTDQLTKGKVLAEDEDDVYGIDNTNDDWNASGKAKTVKPVGKPSTVSKRATPRPTAKQTTVPPTTKSPTARPPTTRRPTTKPPTTKPPTTKPPTTKPPTTKPPTTKPPTTKPPTIQARTQSFTAQVSNQSWHVYDSKRDGTLTQKAENALLDGFVISKADFFSDWFRRVFHTAYRHLQEEEIRAEINRLAEDAIEKIESQDIPCIPQVCSKPYGFYSPAAQVPKVFLASYPGSGKYSLSI